MAVGFVLGDKGLSARKQIVGTRRRAVAGNGDSGYGRGGVPYGSKRLAADGGQRQ